MWRQSLKTCLRCRWLLINSCRFFSHKESLCFKAHSFTALLDLPQISFCLYFAQCTISLSQPSITFGTNIFQKDQVQSDSHCASCYGQSKKRLHIWDEAEAFKYITIMRASDKCRHGNMDILKKVTEWMKEAFVNHCEILKSSCHMSAFPCFDTTNDMIMNGVSVVKTVILDMPLGINPTLLLSAWLDWNEMEYFASKTHLSMELMGCSRSSKTHSRWIGQ